MALPAKLEKIVAEFATAPKALRLPLLLEYARKLPALPPELDGKMEQVHECQTPLFVNASLTGGVSVELHFKAAEEAPTTRGFASVVSAGLNGTTPEELLATPDDFFLSMGLGELISPLRLRGMGAILARVKRQVRELVAAKA